MTIDHLTGLFIFAAGATLGLRHILLSPERFHFPCAPLAVRIALFTGSVALAGYGVRFYFHDEAAGPFAGEAANTVCAASGIFAFYNAIMFANLLLEHRPPGYWPGVERRDRAYKERVRGAQARASR